MSKGIGNGPMFVFENPIAMNAKLSGTLMMSDRYVVPVTGDDPDASAKLGKRGGQLAKRIFASPIPVVGLSQGHAFTIGAVWLACCDVRIGERGDYKYGMTEVKLGVPFSDCASRNRVQIFCVVSITSAVFAATSGSISK